jgi:hypothetical protein
LDEWDNRDFELDRSQSEQKNGSSYLAFDGAAPFLKNWEGNASGRAVGSKINPFPQLFRLMTCFKNRGQ